MVLTVDIILELLNVTIYTHIKRIKILSHYSEDNKQIHKQNKKPSWFKGCHDI